MTPLASFGFGLATAVVLLFVVWVVQLFTRDASPVDVAWTASIGLIALEYALLGDAPPIARVLMAALALVWSLRLASYLAQRMRGAPEDSRYAAARESWGRKADVFMLGFFLLQALIAAVLSIPFLVIAYMPQAPSIWIAVLAILVWLVSVVGEGTADTQLHRFKQRSENKGKVCAEGLWRYSRHPNYFFESLHWVTYVVLAIGAPYWWATLGSPVLMALLLLKVSGVPTIEGRGSARKREGQEEYERRTSLFIPWPPKD